MSTLRALAVLFLAAAPGCTVALSGGERSGDCDAVPDGTSIEFRELGYLGYLDSDSWEGDSRTWIVRSEAEALELDERVAEAVDFDTEVAVVGAVFACGCDEPGIRGEEVVSSGEMAQVTLRFTLPDTGCDMCLSGSGGVAFPRHDDVFVCTVTRR